MADVQRQPDEALPAFDRPEPDDVSGEYLATVQARKTDAFRSKMIDALVDAPPEQPIPEAYRADVEAARLAREPREEGGITEEQRGQVQQFMQEEGQLTPAELRAPQAQVRELPNQLREAGFGDLASEVEQRLTPPTERTPSTAGPEPFVGPAQMPPVTVRARRVGIPEGAEEAVEALHPDALGAAERFERGEFREVPMEQTPPGPSEELTQLGADVARGFLGSTSAFFQALPAFEAFVGLETPFGNTSQDIAGSLAALRDELPAPTDPTFGDKLAEGLGSMIAFWGPGITAGAGVRAASGAIRALAGREALAGALVATGTEAAAEAGSVYEQLRGVVGDEEAARRANKVFWTNTVLLFMTNRTGIFADTGRGLSRLVAGAIGEGLQESVQYDIERRQFWVPGEHPAAERLVGLGWQQDAQTGRVSLPFEVSDMAEAGAIGAILGGGAAVATGEALAQQDAQVRKIIRGDAQAALRQMPESKVRDPATGQLKRVFHGTPQAFGAFEPKQADPNALYGPGFYFTENPSVAGGADPQTAHELGYASTRADPRPQVLGTFPTSQEAREFIAQQRPDLLDETGALSDAVRLQAAHDAQGQQVFRVTARQLASPNVRPAFLDIQNPLQIDDTLDFGALHRAELNLQASDFFNKEEVAGILRSLPEGATGQALYDRLLSEHADNKHEIQQALQAMGFDGITHTGGRIMGGEPHRVWIAFQPDQVVPAFDLMESLLGGEGFAAVTPPQPPGQAPAAPWELSEAEIRRAFPGQQIEPLPDGAFAVTTANGGYVQIRQQQRIPIGEGELRGFELGYGALNVPRDELRQALEATIAGQFQGGLNATGQILLQEGRATRLTLFHESEHFFEDAGILTAADLRVLDRAITRQQRGQPDRSPAENRANFVSEELDRPGDADTPVRRVLTKVRHWLDQLLRGMGIRTAPQIIREIQRGEVFQRPLAPGEPQERGVALSLQEGERRPFFRTMAGRRQAEAEVAGVLPPEPPPPEARGEALPYTIRERAEGLATERLRTPRGRWRVPLRRLPPQELELQDFIRQQGGIRLEGEADVPGELRRRISRGATGTTGLQNNVSGRSLQHMAERAEEFGFTRSADKMELLELLGQSVHQGRPVMSSQATGRVPVLDNPRLGRLLADVTELADTFSVRVEAQRRGTRPRAMVHEEARQLIESGQFTLRDVRAMAPGTHLDDTTASALVQILNRAGTTLQQLAREYLESGAVAESPEERSLLEYFGLFAQLDPARFGASAEASRSLGILNDPLAAMNRFLAQFQDVYREAPEMTTAQLARKVLALKDPRQVSEVVTKLDRPGLGDMLFEAWIHGLISGPTTHVVNFSSNLGMLGLAVTERAVAAQFRGDVQHGEASALAYGMAHAMREAYRVLGTTFMTGEALSGVTKLEIRRKAITAENFGIDPESSVGRALDVLFEVGVRTPGRLLMASDEFFKFISYRGELYAQAYRKGIQRGMERGSAELSTFIETQLPPMGEFRQTALEGRRQGLQGEELEAYIAGQVRIPDPEMARKAREFGLFVTFQNELGSKGQGLQNLRQQLRVTAAGLDLPVGAVVLPFLRTPVNIAKFAWQRTPLAPLFGEWQADFQAGGERRQLALARTTLGTLTMTGMGVLAAQGLVTGRGPEDPALRDALERQGWQQYSIKVWNPAKETYTYVSYNRLDPVGMLMGLVADATQAAGMVENTVLERLISGTFLAFSRNFTSKTYVRGLADFFDAISPRPYGDVNFVTQPFVRFFQRLASSAVPSSVATLERVLDPAKRDMTEFSNAMYRRIPGWSSDVPAWRNVYGEKKLLGYGFKPDVVSGTFNAINPLYLRDAVESPLDAELVANRAGLRNPSRTLGLTLPAGVDTPAEALTAEAVQLQTVKLTAEQYEKYVVLAAANMPEARKLGLNYPAQVLQTVMQEVARGVNTRPPRAAMSLKDALEWVITTPYYQAQSRGPEGGRMEVLQEVQQIYRNAGKALLLFQDEALGQKALAARIFQGMQRVPEAQRPARQRELFQDLQERGMLGIGR